MSDGRKSLVLAALAAIALAGAAVVAWLGVGDDPVVGAPDAIDAPTGANAPPAHADATDPPADDAAPPPPTELRETATALTLRLVGLHAATPWTAALQVDVADDSGHEQPWRGAPDADGVCRVELPEWAHGTAALQLRVRADDPHYAPLAFARDGAIDLHRDLTVDVQVVAVLEGRVLDPLAAPIAGARVTAFALRDGVPDGTRFASVSTDADGAFRARVPPATPLLLLATPMLASELRERFADRGELRTDLLPATQEVLGQVGATTRVPDFVLATATTAQGVLRWSDGAPVPLATIASTASDGVALRLSPLCAVHWLPTGVLVPGASIDTDDDGAFALPCAPGQALEVEVARLVEATLLGRGPRERLVPPFAGELRLPRPVRLQVVREGEPAPRAAVAVAGVRTLTADGTGALELVCLQPIEVRASLGRFRSQWVAIGPTTAGATVTLPLDHELALLELDLVGDHAVRNAAVHWRCDDGREGRQPLLRDDDDGPFRVHLQPGRYHLRVVAAAGERNGTFLLPVETDVELSLSPAERLVLPARFGGTFRLVVTDGNGVPVPGRCRVTDADDADVTGRFRAFGDDAVAHDGDVGELLADTCTHLRVLPAGDYTLVLELGDHGVQRRRVTLREREILEVRLRL